MYWWKDLACWLWGHPIYSPTHWEMGWYSEREGCYKHFSLPKCRRCGITVEKRTIKAALTLAYVYFDWNFDDTLWKSKSFVEFCRQLCR